MDCAVLFGEKATLNPQTETHRDTVVTSKTKKSDRVITERVLLRIHLLSQTRVGLTSVHGMNLQPRLPSP